ncbi:hypothetical protein [Streptomyces sp. AK02-01A]|uniref:hypothetical protein n=1 Tax=Streptomyces sp. AK02-01A TaxID=3028648 RepID=UPI0039F64A35
MSTHGTVLPGVGRGGALVLDARGAGLAAAALVRVLRAPFLVVVAVAVLVTASRPECGPWAADEGGLGRGG